MEFNTEEDATTAIAKFQGYEYGGRQLGLSYARYLNQGGMGGGDQMDQMM